MSTQQPHRVHAESVLKTEGSRVEVQDIALAPQSDSRKDNNQLPCVRDMHEEWRDLRMQGSCEVTARELTFPTTPDCSSSVRTLSNILAASPSSVSVLLTGRYCSECSNSRCKRRTTLLTRASASALVSALMCGRASFARAAPMYRASKSAVLSEKLLVTLALRGLPESTPVVAPPFPPALAPLRPTRVSKNNRREGMMKDVADARTGNEEHRMKHTASTAAASPGHPDVSPLARTRESPSAVELCNTACNSAMCQDLKVIARARDHTDTRMVV